MGVTFGWAADPGEPLADMEALCQSMDTDFFGFDPFMVVAGNVAVDRVKVSEASRSALVG